MNGEVDYLCVGICLPDADEAYCIGCGRPWGTPAVPPAPTFSGPAAVAPQPLPPQPAPAIAPGDNLANPGKNTSVTSSGRPAR